MNKSQIKLKEVVAVIRRRIKLLVLPPVVITIVCAVGSMFLPRMYESTIRILIQRTDVINPLTSLANAMSQTNDDPLRSFDEIIFSQRTFEQVMDSLGLSQHITSEVERRELMVRIKNSIQTKMQERESFTITYQDSDPHRAQHGAAVLANIFIWTVTNVKNQRNEFTVDFYQKKLDDFRTKMDESQQQLMTKMRQQNSGSSAVNATMYARIDQIDQKLQSSDNALKEYQRTLVGLRTFPAAINTKEGKQTLFEIQRSNVPYAPDLRPLLAVYDDVSSRYTAEHPEVLKVENQILSVLERMNVAIKTEVSKINSEIDEMRKDKAGLMEELLQSTEIKQADRDVESNYQIYQKLYDEMKIKLEEAQISKVLGSNLEGQFIVMDPPLLPLFPSKPSRSFIVGGGMMLGILLGILSAIVAEFLDTTIRSPQTLEIYRKPVIAFLPDVKDKE